MPDQAKERPLIQSSIPGSPKSSEPASEASTKSLSENLEVPMHSKDMACDDSGALMSNIEAGQSRILINERAFADDAELDYSLRAGGPSDEISEPLTVRSIICRIGKVWRANTKQTFSERA